MTTLLATLRTSLEHLRRPGTARQVRIVEVLPLGPGAQLAVAVFGERQLLLAVSKGNVSLIAEQAA